MQVPQVECNGNSGFTVTINDTLCQGCGNCARFCPLEIIAVVKKKARLTGHSTLCTGCGACVVVCDRGGIKVEVR